MSGHGKYHGRGRGPGRGLWSARAGPHFHDPVLVTGRARKVAGDRFTARLGAVDKTVHGPLRAEERTGVFRCGS